MIKKRTSCDIELRIETGNNCNIDRILKGRSERLDSPPSEIIKKELLRWRGVTMHEHNFASMRFYVDGAEMGHLHGDMIADLQFPVKLGKKLVTEGRVSPHHIIPRSGWVSHEIQNAKDVEEVMDLFRFQYKRLSKSK